jgi:membrane-bound ClpP family serine protease
MEPITILIFLVTAALLGGGMAMTFRLIEINRSVPAIGDGTELLGRRAIATSTIDGGTGWIEVQNQRWRAALSHDALPVKAGATVRIVKKLGGLVLLVEPLEVRTAKVVPLPARGRSPGDRRAA